MFSVTQVSVDEFLKINEKPNREYRNGVVTVKAWPTKFHSLIMLALANLLQQQGVEAYLELMLRLSPTKFLVSDLTVAADFPGDYPTDPVFLCCEILSPDDRLGATLSKCEEFHAWGVPYCWIIDPVKRTAWEYHRDFEPTQLLGGARAHPGRRPLRQSGRPARRREILRPGGTLPPARAAGGAPESGSPARCRAPL